jgi:coenzyme F420-dependent glucose-6-phosphate dehydrogenase
MAHFGYTLSSEEFGPRELVDLAVRGEEEGFEFLSISDHYHPWVTEQGHSPFVWSVLGGVATATERISVGTGVTCPTVRIHPAVVAHAVATTSLLFGDAPTAGADDAVLGGAPGRFFLGVGSGEALNEHILGHRWPPPEVRLQMLDEAVDIMRRLWTGGTVDHDGPTYRVENARLFDPPAQPVPVVVSGYGPMSVEVAARIGDGYWGHSPEAEVIERFEQAGGSGPRLAQIMLCWDTDTERARETVHRVWPNGGLTGQLSQDLPTWTHFEQATSVLNQDQAVGSMPCGPDVEPVLEQVRAYLDAGYDHLYFHQIGPDQEGFLGFWRSELRSAVSELRPVAA